jgi:hypothetical protein
MHIVDDEQCRDRPQSPCSPSGSGGAEASAALPLLDDVTPSPASRRPGACPPGARAKMRTYLGANPGCGPGRTEAPQHI